MSQWEKYTKAWVVLYCNADISPSDITQRPFRATCFFPRNVVSNPYFAELLVLREED